MPPQFNATSIPLFKATGIPAMNAACCCDVPPECLCTALKFLSGGDCGCITEEYPDDIYDRGDLTVDITGSMTGFPLSVRFPIWVFPQCPAPGSCVDISGSYVVPIETTHHYVHCQYVCTVQQAFTPTYDYYYVTQLRFDHRCLPFILTTNLGLSTGLRTIVASATSLVYRALAGTTNIYPTLTGPLTSPPVFAPNFSQGQESYFDGTRIVYLASQRIWSWIDPFTTLADWLFQPDTLCTSDCNTIIQRRQCVSGSLSATTNEYYDSGLNSCGMAGISMSASLGAPVLI